MSSQTNPAFLPKSTVFGVIGLFTVLVTFGLAKEWDVIEGGLAKRAVGMLLSAMLIVLGNVLPKLVRPISGRRGNPVRHMAAERFAGWTFVLTGVVCVAVWLFAPLESVMLIASLVGLSAFSLVFATWAWLAWGEHSQVQQETLVSEHSAEMSQRAPGIRGGLFLLLHALFWVFAIFLADSIWGDSVSQWMGVFFVVVSGVLATYMAARSRVSE